MTTNSRHRKCYPVSRRSKIAKEQAQITKDQQKAQRIPLDNTPNNEDVFSVANTALHMHQMQMQNSSVYSTNKTDGVVPLATTTREVAGHSTPIFSAESRRLGTGTDAVTKALNQGGALDFSKLDPGSRDIIKIADYVAGTQSQNILVPIAKPWADISDTNTKPEGRNLRSIPQEADSSSSIKAFDPEPKSAEDSGVKEFGASIMEGANAGIVDFNSESGESASLAEQAAEVKGNVLEIEQELAPNEAEAQEEEPAELEAKEEVAQEEIEAKLEPDAAIELIPALKEADIGAASIPPLEAIEQKEEGEEEELFGQQHRQEENMAKSFELP